ncbi:hypothetical protein FPQ18DRAFT_337060 [Pyronema domesticum]|nr:hypothetical protein FPQ18DRAFT_337060 [Pyronema domesticum]
MGWVFSIAGFLFRCFVSGCFLSFCLGWVKLSVRFLLLFVHLISFIICIGLGVCLFGWLQGGREAYRMFIS